MVCPTNIYRNEETTEDNIFYIPEERWNEMIGKTGPRETRKEVLFEFANLHRILTQLGMEIYLFTHESFEETPDAVCVNDWFRSFPATGETPATLIIHPMKAPSRQREKFNPVLLSLLESTYKRFFNLTPCEQGDLKVSDSFHCKSTALNDAGDKKRYYLEAHTITLDRINNVGYCAVGKNVRASNEVKKIWKEITNYELVEFHLKNEEFYQKLHNTNFIFNMGTDWAIVCFEAISPEEQLIIRERLSKTKKLIISISKQQLTNFGAAGVLEVLSSNHKPAMLISTSAESALGAENVELLRGCVEVLHVVDVSALEYTCGGSLSSLLGFLY
uniref:Amidinotransferase n=1 Tax=Arcella intermedia TaxID=1963864 RepID=A0A6B2L943_9EUKA